MERSAIRDRIESLKEYYRARPEKAVSGDPPAVARLEGGLRCRIAGPAGSTAVTDMPPAVGGDKGAPSPGWYLRAAVAACNATVIAMRAAELDVELSVLEVRVESESDNRGLLGGAEAPVAPLRMRTRVRIGGSASETELREIAGWAESHSPVLQAVKRSVPSQLDIDVEAGVEDR